MTREYIVNCSKCGHVLRGDKEFAYFVARAHRNPSQDSYYYDHVTEVVEA